MTTFSILYAQHGPDVELIAAELRIQPSSVDRLINKAMDEKYAAKAKAEAEREYQRQYRADNPERLQEHRKRHNAAIRANLREIRARHAG
jgi:hypothetical protein